jgi:tRNA(Leu) C34 or U34 (ribose-2'-O)-methylase TrmL
LRRARLVGPDPAAPLEEVFARPGCAWLLCGVAYPGNAGYAIRTAEVSGAERSCSTAPSTPPAAGSPRARRCTPTASFAVRWLDAAAALAAARAADRRVVAIEDSGTAAPWDVDVRGRVLFVIGGETRGIPPAVLARCDAVLRIPMRGFIPAYNLQAAMAIVAGERLRQEAAESRRGLDDRDEPRLVADLVAPAHRDRRRLPDLDEPILLENEHAPTARDELREPFGLTEVRERPVTVVGDRMRDVGAAIQADAFAVARECPHRVDERPRRALRVEARQHDRLRDELAQPQQRGRDRDPPNAARREQSRSASAKSRANAGSIGSRLAEPLAGREREEEHARRDPRDEETHARRVSGSASEASARRPTAIATGKRRIHGRRSWGNFAR